MSILRRTLLVAFIESFACILVERGIYFYSTYRLGFGEVANLWLAVAFGAAYVIGATLSHPLCKKLGERRALSLAVLGQVALHVCLACWPTPITVFIATTLIGAMNGAKWPIVESYVSAGQTPSAAAKAVGWFNISWAVAVPPALVIVGPLIARYPSLPGDIERLLNVSLFVLAAALNIVTLLLVRPLPRRPIHLPHDHPDRPAAGAMTRLRSMLAFSRWNMFFSYAGLFAMAALMPPIFKDLGCSESLASALSGLVDLMRLAAFVLLMRTAAWHHRWLPLVMAMLAAPVGFVLVVTGTAVWPMVIGEIAFGAAAGMTYYAALYYAMVVQNASVDAGGAHEGLIGLGFAAGPLACLAGVVLSPMVGGQAAAMLVGSTPLFLLCAAGAILAARDRSPGLAAGPQARVS